MAGGVHLGGTIAPLSRRLSEGEAGDETIRDLYICPAHIDRRGPFVSLALAQGSFEERAQTQLPSSSSM